MLWQLSKPFHPGGLGKGAGWYGSYGVSRPYLRRKQIHETSNLYSITNGPIERDWTGAMPARDFSQKSPFCFKWN